MPSEVTDYKKFVALLFLYIFEYKPIFNMKGFLNIKDPNTFLGGQNVHNLLILGALAWIIFKK